MNIVIRKNTLPALKKKHPVPSLKIKAMPPAVIVKGPRAVLVI